MRNLKTQKMTFYAFFLAILTLLTFTPIGYIPLGPIKATIIHLPVIFFGLCLGKKDGIIAGILFGISSLLANTLTPGILSFCFSPFITVANLGGSWMSLIICFIPRIILGYLSGMIGEKINGKSGMSGCAMGVSILHSVLVLGLIFLIFKDAYANVIGINSSAVLIALVTTFITQSIVEATLAFFFIYLIHPYILQIKAKYQ